MTSYSWTVIINKLPYGVKAAQPWTAVSRALQKYCEEHPDSSMILFDIYLLNRTVAEKEGLVKILKDLESDKTMFSETEQAGDKDAKERS